MNATEARELSLSSADNIASELLEEAIKEMEEEIKKSAKKGGFAAVVRVPLNDNWVQNNSSIKFQKHFMEKGYRVETNTFRDIADGLIRFICRW